MYHDFKIGDRIVQTRYAGGRRAGMTAEVVGLVGQATLTVLFDGATQPRNAYAKVFKLAEPTLDIAVPQVATDMIAKLLAETAPAPVAAPVPDDRFLCDHVLVYGGQVSFGPASLQDCMGSYLNSASAVLCKLTPVTL